MRNVILAEFCGNLLSILTSRCHLVGPASRILIIAISGAKTKEEILFLGKNTLTFFWKKSFFVQLLLLINRLQCKHRLNAQMCRAKKVALNMKSLAMLLCYGRPKSLDPFWDTKAAFIWSYSSQTSDLASTFLCMLTTKKVLWESCDISKSNICTYLILIWVEKLVVNLLLVLRVWHRPITPNNRSLGREAREL